MRHFILTAWVLAAACFMAGTAIPSRPVLAQSPRLDRAAWIGVTVMPKLDAVVKVGNVVVDSSENHTLSLPWIVQDVNGGWLYVGEATKGWVKRSQVCTLDEAPAYYTKVLAEAALVSDEEELRVLNLRAMTWEEKGDLDRAIADYGEAIEFAPSTVGYTNRGIAWSKKKEYDKAIADFDQAIQLDPTNGFAYNNRGVDWKNKREYDKAIADFTQAIRLNPKDSYAYKNRGWVWHLKKEYDKALLDYQHSLELDPNNSLAYDSSAWLRATCPEARYRDGERAVINATKACELTGWTDVNNISTLAAAYAESGDFDAAIKYQQQTIDLDPNDAEFVKEANERIAQYREKKPYRY